MIVLDTHIWVWWAHGDSQLTKAQLEAIDASEPDGVGISAISLWEVTKLFERKRLVLPCPIGEWSELSGR